MSPLRASSSTAPGGRRGLLEIFAPGRDPWALLVISALISAALAIVYLSEGGASYRPMDVADPCAAREGESSEGFDGALQEVALSALDGAACSLQITREELTLVLADPEERERFGAERDLTEEQIEAAVRDGLARAVDDAEADGRISGTVASIVRAALSQVPVGTIIDVLQIVSDDDPIGLIAELAERAADDPLGPVDDFLQDLRDDPAGTLGEAFEDIAPEVEAVLDEAESQLDDFLDDALGEVLGN